MHNFTLLSGHISRKFALLISFYSDLLGQALPFTDDELRHTPLVWLRSTTHCAWSTLEVFISTPTGVRIGTYKVQQLLIATNSLGQVGSITYQNQQDSQRVIFPKSFQTIVNIVRIEVMVAHRQEQGAGGLPHYVVWNNTIVELPWNVRYGLQQRVAPLKNNKISNQIPIILISNRGNSLLPRDKVIRRCCLAFQVPNSDAVWSFEVGPTIVHQRQVPTIPQWCLAPDFLYTAGFWQRGSSAGSRLF